MRRGGFPSPRRGGVRGGVSSSPCRRGIRKGTTMPNRDIVTGQKIDPAKLERAKALRRNMTPAERRLWARLRANRLDGLHFRRQQVIDGFIVDFYCHAARLVVEVDGPVHEERVEYDVERSRILAARGLRILRVRNEEVMQNLGDVLTRIRAACRAGADLTPRPPSLGGKGESGDGGGSPPRHGEGSLPADVGADLTPRPPSLGGKGESGDGGGSPPRIGEGSLPARAGADRPPSLGGKGESGDGGGSPPRVGEGLGEGSLPARAGEGSGEGSPVGGRR
jgi:very-short-patch-repair endonuclease